MRRLLLGVAVAFILLAALLAHDIDAQLGWLGVALWALSEL